MADWLGITSAELHSDCGDNGGSITIEAGLDGDNYWGHNTGHIHWFIIDLGASYTISKVKAYSITSFDPDDVNIYVSDDAGDFGSVIEEGITTWQDTASYVEIEITPTVGRYVKVEIESTEIGQVLQFGKTSSPRPGGIFDAYGEIYIASSIPGTNLATIRRLVAVGNDKVYYEDI